MKHQADGVQKARSRKRLLVAERKAIMRPYLSIRKLWHSFDSKPLFDHIRNYTIAGAVGVGAILYVQIMDRNDFVSWSVFIIAVVLYILNTVTGASWIYRQLINCEYIKKDFSFMAIIVALLYIVVLIYFGGVVFLSILGKASDQACV